MGMGLWTKMMSGNVLKATRLIRNPSRPELGWAKLKRREVGDANQTGKERNSGETIAGNCQILKTSKTGAGRNFNIIS
jgi:hypothetical protein